MPARTLTAALAAMLAATPAPAQVAQYIVTPLGPPPNSLYTTSGAAGLNNAGQIAANITTLAPGQVPFRAARYTPGVGTADLGSLAPNGTSRAEGINSAGQVVGSSANPGTFNRAFMFADGVGMVNLGVLPGDVISEAYGINDAGVVVGSSQSATSGRVFRYTSVTGMTDLGVPPAAASGSGVAINNAGVIVARGSVSGATRTFRYTDATGYVDIGTLGGTEARGEAINASGTIVGSSLNSAGVSRAFRLAAVGGMQDLGTLPGLTGSAAESVNGAGDVVGNAFIPNVGGLTPFLYRDELGMVDLNTLIGSGTGWTLSNATGINDFGQITGTGVFGGVQRAFLLTPIPEPSAFLLVSTVAAAGAALRRYRRFGPR